MKIEKRSSSYRVQIQKNKRRYSLLFDHRPTKSEIESALDTLVLREKKKNGCDMSFEQAAFNYAENKKNVLSATTYREYIRSPQRLPEWFVKMRLLDITQNDVNKVVNELALNKQPKTVRNYHGFISAVISTYNPALTLNTKLPQKIKKDIYIPTDDDVKKILEYSKGSDFEIALTLMAYGLRRSEVCAITSDDVDGDCIHIRKALVFNSDKEWVVKTTKTTESTRDIFVPQEIADKIKKDGQAYKGHPNSIAKYLNRTQDKLGIPRFSVHKLRHYFASKMSQLGVPDADIIALGGWKTDAVMKTIYRHSLQSQEQKRQAAQKLSNALFN